MADFLEQAWPFAAAVLVILAAAALIALIVVLVRAAKSMKHINTITAEAEKEVTPALKRVDPLIDRAELTVDTLNLELLRVDAILEDVEQVTDVAANTADAVNTITTAPTNAVAGLAEKIRGALGGKHKAKMKEGRMVYPIGAGSAESGKHSMDAKGRSASEEQPEPAEKPAEAEQSSAETAPDAEGQAPAPEESSAEKTE